MDIYKHLKLTLVESKEKSDDSDCEKRKELLDLLKDANKELEKYYAGRYKFDISDKIKNELDNVKKITPKRKRKIKEIWLKFDSELCKIQREYNSFLQDSMKKDKNK